MAAYGRTGKMKTKTNDEIAIVNTRLKEKKSALRSVTDLFQSAPTGSS
jgi:hypothetical protein